MRKRTAFLCWALSLANFSSWAYADNSTDLRVGTPDTSNKKTKVGRVNSSFDLKETKNVLFLLDVSGEMKSIFPEKKLSYLDKAKEIIETALAEDSSSVSYGLRIYGSEEKWKADQKNTLVVPLGSDSKKKIIDALKTIQPEEPGSLEYALDQSFNNDLAGVRSNSLIVIICAGKSNLVKPFRYVESQAKIENLPAKIVAVNLNDKTGTESSLEKTMKARSQNKVAAGKAPWPADCLKQICSNTDGKYYSVADISLLIKDLKFTTR